LGDIDMLAVRRYLDEHRDDMLADLKAFVERETPSEDKGLLDSFADHLAGYAEERTGARATIIPHEVAGNHVRAEWGSGNAESPVLLLGHYDTVWPAGTLESMPFAVRGDTASGPGVFDMKCGLVQGFWGVKALREVAGVDRRVVLVCNSDEELGSPHSRPFVEEAAMAAEATLVLEPTLGGALKTSRKGESLYLVRIRGRAAHTGLDPEKGVSAVQELARLVLELHGHNDPDGGTTVNVGVVRGGSRHNVVAAEAEAEVDIRFVIPEEERRMDALVRGLRPRADGASIEVEGGEVWPAMRRNEKISRVFETARRIGGELGLEVEEAAAGGSSDGCFCAALGMPVLDGLGAVGAGAHAEDEHVVISTMPERAALVSGLLAEL
jgi:glutamate carboxypeptidase